jgi:hypothetical protein
VADKSPDLLETIFADGHKPVRKIGRGMYHGGQAISFPTNKVGSGIVRARSNLMADGLLHLDTDPNVVHLSPYPMEVAYWSTFDGETPAKRDHIPDMAILLRGGPVEIVHATAEQRCLFLLVRHSLIYA